MNAACVAIDVGGTKIRGAIIDAAGTMRCANTFATNAQAGREAVLDGMRASIDALLFAASLTPAQIAGCGISSAGVIDPRSRRVVSAAQSMPGWQGVDFGAAIGERFGWRVTADNDVNCALLGERWKGAVADAPSDGLVMMITLGTGLGGALMADGKLIRGRNFLTGHIGQNWAWDAANNRPMRVEEIVSGTGLGTIYARLKDRASSTGREVIAALDNGDAIAQQALDAWLDALSIQLQNIHWLLDPTQLIIGGGMIDARAYWWHALQQRLVRANTPIHVVPAALGNDAGVFGAARMLWDEDETTAAEVGRA